MKSFEDWVGRHFIIGLQPTLALSDHDRSLLSALRPQGVILYKSNFDHNAPYEDWLDTLATLIADVREVVKRDDLLIGIDHEGARVCRTPPPITRYTYPMRWADKAEAVGAAMGRELASLGVNLSFAPLLDVHSNPDNPVIGERAFSTDPEVAASAAIAFMTGLEAQGVAACGKHFPGHGDTDLDSHKALPELRHSLQTLRGRELIPFQRAIAAGLSSIMTSHIMFPSLDAAWPATLSEPIIRGILREELGFEGLVMSDDVGMKAMDPFFNRPEAMVRFLNAGNDMLMICAFLTDTRRALGFAEAMVEARRQGALSQADLDAAAARISSFAKRMPQHSVQPLSLEAFARHAQAGPLFGGETVEVV